MLRTNVPNLHPPSPQTEVWLAFLNQCPTRGHSTSPTASLSGGHPSLTGETLDKHQTARMWTPPTPSREIQNVAAGCGTPGNHPGGTNNESAQGLGTDTTSRTTCRIEKLQQRQGMVQGPLARSLEVAFCDEAPGHDE